MRVLSQLEQMKMDLRIMAYASSYAMRAQALEDRFCMEPVMATENGTTERRTYVEASCYVQAGLIQIAREVTGDESLTDYDSFTEDYASFEDRVNEHLPRGYYVYLQNGDVFFAQEVSSELSEVAV